MAQSSNSTNNMNDSSDISTKTAANKEIKTMTERAAPGQDENQKKKAKIDFRSAPKYVSSVAPKFISAAEIAGTNIRTNVQAMPEISDEEFLQMAIKFEMEHHE